jgi:hypothetical protein
MYAIVVMPGGLTFFGSITGGLRRIEEKKEGKRRKV